MAIVSPGRLLALFSVIFGERNSWRFEGSRESVGETMAVVGVSGALLGCKLDETCPGVGVDGEGVVEVEASSRISRAVRVSEVGVARVDVGVLWELSLGECVFVRGNMSGDWSKCWLRRAG